MAENDAQERTEEATPRRKLEARKKGTVAKSVELTSSLVMLALLIAFPSCVTLLGRGFMQGMTSGFTRMPQDVSFASIMSYVISVARPALLGLGIILAISLIVGVASTTAQVGLVFSGEALQPNFAKLNPLSGFKRMFSGTLVTEALKALVKSLFFGFLAYSAAAGAWPKLVSLGWVSPEVGMTAVGDVARGMAIRIAGCWLVLAGIDYMIQRKRIDKQLRMSKYDIKKEMRETDTKPEIKAELSRKRRRLARGRMMQAMQRASVVITNPTHYAVAIEYDPDKHTAPVVVAKGVDFLAKRIREVAGEHDIPIVPNPPLARALYKQCEPGDAIPRELFQPVAEVLAYVYKTIKKIRARL